MGIWAWVRALFIVVQKVWWHLPCSVIGRGNPFLPHWWSNSTLPLLVGEFPLLSIPSDPVTSVSFSRDGHCVLASSLDEKIRLLDRDNGELLNE